MTGELVVVRKGALEAWWKIKNGILAMSDNGYYVNLRTCFE